MRNIKFRAWDKVDKTMYTDAINNCKDTFDMILKHPQIYEVMQFTGLKGNDGIEVYEGDIVNTIDGKMHIEYLKDSFQCVDVKGNNHKLLDYVYIGCIKVIGNIYKNPELLKEGLNDN